MNNHTLLAALTAKGVLAIQMPCHFSLWETSYFHVMADHEQILTMIKSTGLKPYLNAIHDDAQKAAFEQAVLQCLLTIYQKQKDGQVLFPFKRLFLLASNG